jgi:riboflavin synthase
MSKELDMTDSTGCEHAERLADDIERYAAFVRANPDLAEDLYRQNFLIYLLPGDDPKSKMAGAARAGLRAGATVDKKVDDKYAEALLRFGHITVQVYTQRDVVCERIVVGAHEETVEEQDPEALAKVPTRKVTKVVEDVEWRCMPLLAAEQPIKPEAEVNEQSGAVV